MNLDVLRETETMIKTGVEDRFLHFGSIFVHLFCKKNGYRSNC